MPYLFYVLCNTQSQLLLPQSTLHQWLQLGQLNKGLGAVCNDLPVLIIEMGDLCTLPIRMVLFPCWLSPSLPPLELEPEVTAAVEAVVVIESVLSPEQTIVQRTY